MKALVTGANGHIGSHVVRACIDAGIEPIGLCRPGSDRRALAGVDLEIREGDLLGRDSIERAARGVDLVFHVGSPHKNWASDEAAIMRPAVDGTRHVLEAAKRNGARRVVVTSSGATVGFADDPTRPLDESAHVRGAKSVYIRSKVQAEELALAAAADDLEVIVVNPSGVFGPRDYRLTPATRGILGALQGDPLFFALSVTDVRDVARAHVLAAQKGISGRRYLLTGDVLAPGPLVDLFADITGIRPSTMKPPRFILRIIAALAERKARREGGDAAITRDQIDDVLGRHLAYDSGRARKELGAEFRPAREVLLDAVRWLLFLDALKPKVAAKVRTRLGDAARADSDWLAPRRE